MEQKSKCLIDDLLLEWAEMVGHREGVLQTLLVPLSATTGSHCSGSVLVMDPLRTGPLSTLFGQSGEGSEDFFLIFGSLVFPAQNNRV